MVPAVTALVIPQHATATSISSAGGPAAPGDLNINNFETQTAGSDYITVVQTTTAADISGYTVTISNRTTSLTLTFESDSNTANNFYNFSVVTTVAPDTNADYTISVGSTE